MSQLTEREHDPSIEAAREFYSGLSIPDIFGRKKDNPMVIPITFEQYREWNRDLNKARDFVRALDFEEIGYLSSWEKEVGGPALVETGITSKLTLWLPYIDERQAILEIAQTVAQNKRPLILEVGSGTGFVAKLLALDGNIDVIGIDIDKYPDKYKTNRVSHVPNVTRLTGDIWDVIDTFGPSYEADEKALRRKLFSAIKDAGSTIAVGGHIAAPIGSVTELNEEIAQLQSVSQKTTKGSQVDVVLCSFMDLNSELTIPIRDGIFPKVIIYIRPTNGMSGAGDYYKAIENEGGGIIDEDELVKFDDDTDYMFPPNINTHISFNPGINYSTVSRWRTLWESDYPSGYSWDTRKDSKPTGEVVVQLRNDIVLGSARPLVAGEYKFDSGIEELLGENLQEFLAGIKSAQSNLINV